MGYVQEFSIMGAVGPCRMFILSKRSQLRTSLRNYSVFNVGMSRCCRKKRVKLVHTHMRTHAHTHTFMHTRGRYVWSVTVKCLECVLWHSQNNILPLQLPSLVLYQTHKNPSCCHGEDRTNFYSIYEWPLSVSWSRPHRVLAHSNRCESKRCEQSGSFWRRRFHFIRLTTFLIWSDFHNKDSLTHSRGGL